MVLQVGLPDLGLERRLGLVEDHGLEVADNHMVLLRGRQARTVVDRLAHSVGVVEGPRMTAALVEALAVGEGHGDPQRSN